MPTYKQLSVKNPEYDAMYWARCRALYAGGKKLLADKKVLEDVFPKHLSEEDFVYRERCKRAYYIPYAGEIIDSIVAGLFSEKVTVSSEPEADEFYEDFFEDCSKPGGKKTSLPELLKEQLITALCCRRAWTLVDLPETKEDDQPATLKEQEEAGDLDAYACSLAPEAVWDWEVDESGELEWAIVHYQYQKRDSLESEREIITEEWIHYTPTTWTKYRISYKKDKPPRPEDAVQQVKTGTHSFERVPIIPLEVTDGMWAMGKIEPIAVAHLNKRNALTWAEYKSLFPVLVHKQGESNPLIPITEDPNRATNQTYGIGRVLTFGAEDSLEYVGPDAAPFVAAMQDLNNLRDEMHRVLHHMAMSVDNSGAALQRSGESKQVDQEATSIILRALGQVIREHVRRIYEMVEAGRQDDEREWSVDGMEKFNETSTSVMVEQAAVLDTISLPAPTFQRKWRFSLAKRLLGDNVTEEELLQIEKELETNITDEQYDSEALMDRAAENEMAAIESSKPPPADGAAKNPIVEGKKKAQTASKILAANEKAKAVKAQKKPVK